LATAFTPLLGIILSGVEEVFVGVKHSNFEQMAINPREAPQ